MKRKINNELPVQNELKNSVVKIPIEYFKWGRHPDHFKIDMPHRHRFSELLFFIKGSGTHEIEYKDYQIENGSIHYIPKSTVHFLNRDRLAEGFTIAFDSSFFESNNIHKFLNPLKLEAFTILPKAKKFQEIMDQCKLILTQIKQDRGQYQQKCFLLAVELLLHSIAGEKQIHLVQDDNETKVITTFKNLVTTNIHLEHRVSWYAEKLHISPKSLGNQVKRQLGISPKKYLQQVLLTSIKRNLIDTNKSIKQIAMDYNCNVSLLGKLFKKQVGFTMKAYRSYRSEENQLS